MADRPLRPAIHLRLGGPLPRQLTNGTWAHLMAAGLTVPAFPKSCDSAYAVLATVSRSYPPPQGRSPCITHPCATKVLLPPSDLHVLGTPPAFVLSQDQTLSSYFLSCDFFFFLTSSLCKNLAALTRDALASCSCLTSSKPLTKLKLYSNSHTRLPSRTLFLLSSLVK